MDTFSKWSLRFISFGVLALLNVVLLRAGNLLLSLFLGSLSIWLYLCVELLISDRGTVIGTPWGINAPKANLLDKAVYLTAFISVVLGFVLLVLGGTF